MTQMLSNKTVYVYGLMGCGKTIVSVSEVKREFDEGRRVISNIPLNFPHKFVEHPDDLDSALAFDGRKTLLLDEVGKWCMSRLSRSKINIKMGQIYSYTRKRDCNVWLTDQRLKNLDVMLRGITNYFYRPLKLPLRVDLPTYPYIQRYGKNWEQYYKDDFLFECNELENNVVVCRVYNTNGVFVTKKIYDDLKKISDLYYTRYEVKSVLDEAYS